MRRTGHLRRVSRVAVQDSLYFITTCVDDHKDILASDDAVAILVRTWHKGRSLYGWATGSYVVMPDHVHFFCRPGPEAVSLSRFVGKWKEWTAKGIVGAMSRPSRVWQREFFDHILRSEESYSEKWNYVRENPVRAGLVASAEEWRYSGHIHFP